MAVLQRDYLPADLRPLLEATGFQRSVVVQVAQNEEENAFLLGLAEAEPTIAAVVGWVDLCSPDAPARLAHWARHPKLRGVRHLAQSEPDDFQTRPDFQRGIAALESVGLVNDICIYERHLPATLELVRKFPRQPFVLDHIGKPRIKARELSPWRERFRELAALPNVCCKLSGMVTEADWSTWTAADLAPYLDVALEAFGPDRLMIGSDWPVCLLAADYPTVMTLVKERVSALSASEQDKVLGGTAARFYGIQA
jgi:L-fuconolactonase